MGSELTDSPGWQITVTTWDFWSCINVDGAVALNRGDMKLACSLGSVRQSHYYMYAFSMQCAVYM